MPLKFKHASQAEIPAEHARLYVERDGAWHLDVEGAVERAKLEEFRSSNVALLKERDELKARFAGIDPEAVRALEEEKRRLEEAAQLKAGEFEQVLAARVKGARGELEQQLAGVRGERDALHARLAVVEIDQAVLREATQRGLRATALPDITARARTTFRLVDGVPQAFESDGRTPRAGRDGVTPLSVAEWVETQVTAAPHLFADHAGGGAPGVGPGGAAVPNPFRKETWNVTEQMRLLKADASLAARLKREG